MGKGHEQLSQTPRSSPNPLNLSPKYFITVRYTSALMMSIKYCAILIPIRHLKHDMKHGKFLFRSEAEFFISFHVSISLFLVHVCIYNDGMELEDGPTSGKAGRPSALSVIS